MNERQSAWTAWTRRQPGDAMDASWLRFAAVVLGLLVAVVAAVAYALSMPREGWYFPPNSIDVFWHDAFRQNLEAMHEPVLRPAAGASAEVAALRIVCVPTWGNKVAVRYTFDETGATRRAVEMGSRIGEEGKFLVDRTTRLTPQQSTALLASLERSGYWRMPAEEENDGNDGKHILVEALRGDEHRVVWRWSPGYDVEQRGLAPFLAFYSGALAQAGVGRVKSIGAQGCIEQ